ncbi:J domain-containing protein [Herbaspirillum chlorophenolicum]|uniref:J domain-containing protein n=1 Tax=Herbaspirillum chlorophenolicum TaxID=211589 RepID=A0ABW8F5P6_9BURK
MTASSIKAVTLSASSRSILSAEQEVFNTLVRQIGRQREQLAAWEQVSGLFQKTYIAELVPLRLTAGRLTRELILKLDAHENHEELSSSERQTISALVLKLLQEFDSDALDAELKAIYNRHGSSDYDQEVALEVAEMKAELEQMFGESLGEDLDLNSREELMRRARAKLAQHEAREAAKEEARARRKDEKASKAGRKKAGKSAESPLRKEKLQAELAQPLREIYRKLASALHPDREPDAELRVRKTELMQSLNQAYAAQDLLRLLELQIELQQIDRDALHDIGDDRLRQYNSLLRDQLTVLEGEIRQTEAQFIHSYGLASSRRLTPDNLIASLHAEMEEVRVSVDAMEGNLGKFSDLKVLKRWLKDVKKNIRASTMDS